MQKLKLCIRNYLDDIKTFFLLCKVPEKIITCKTKIIKMN